MSHKTVIPGTEALVPRQTPRAAQQAITERSIQQLQDLADKPPSEMFRAIKHLSAEWDIERVLEMNASVFALTGLVLSVMVDKTWLWLCGGVLVFLLQHAIQGWCPPMPLFRYFGYRTTEEIEDVKNAVKVLRGDYNFAMRSEKHSAVDAMIKNKREKGAFIGVASIQLPASSTSALDKEE